MEKFLKDYVKTYLEAIELDLPKDQLTDIVNMLMAEDEIWDTMDSYINDYLEDLN